jgi:hypothetical protein
MDKKATVKDIAGNDVAVCCANCEHIDDVSDGPEYSNWPWYQCSKKPHMGHLKSFPFKTPQRCFELHYAHLVDWAAEARKMDEEYASRPAGEEGEEGWK